MHDSNIVIPCRSIKLSFTILFPMLLQFSSQVIKHGFLISLRNAQVAVAIGYSPFIAVALTTRSIRQSRLSSSSSKGWRMRQHKDYFTLFAKASCLKSRAAYKLLEVSGNRGEKRKKLNGCTLDQRKIPDT